MRILSYFLLPLVLTVIVGCRNVSEPQKPRGADPLFGGVPDARSVPDTPKALGPILTVTNQYLDPVVSTSLNDPPTIMNMPGGYPLVFCWTAETSNGGGAIEAYRYGWDILDVNDPEQWETAFIAFDGSEVCAPPRTFFFGSHTFAVEVIDNHDMRSRVMIIANHIPGPPSFDILPGSCRNPLSPRKKGVIPATIPGTPGFDVRDIDLSTLSLWIDGNTVAPLRTRIGDIASPLINREVCDCPPGGADGIDDLLLKFSAEDVIAALGPVSRGDVREIAIRGLAHDGPDFWLPDCVAIVGPMAPEPPQLQHRDDVLITLESAYNEKNLDDARMLLDSDFIFFFSAEDIQGGDVSVAQWDQPSELHATANLFDIGAPPGASELDPMTFETLAHSGASGNLAPLMMGIEAATWGKIKYIFFGDDVTDETLISLSLLYPPGEDFWNTVIPDPTAYPHEVWYEKTAEYRLSVWAGDTTWLNLTVRRASFVVRQTELGGESIWQLVQWRDDI